MHAQAHTHSQEGLAGVSQRWPEGAVPAGTAGVRGPFQEEVPGPNPTHLSLGRGDGAGIHRCDKHPVNRMQWKV